MEQKTYTFPKTGGGEVTKSLAPPTLKRIADFLELFGAKSFDELRTGDGQINYAMFVLETGRDPEKLKKALDICLVEGSVDIDFVNLDLRLSDEVIQDFFEQRSKTLLSRIQRS
jgi:hypothetical protein